MNWIIENGMQLLLLVAGAVGTLWTYTTTKKNRALELKLTESDSKLKELEVNAGHINLDAIVNDSVEKAIIRTLRLKAEEIADLEGSYKKRLSLLKEELIDVELELDKVATAKSKASELADSYKELINRLRQYNDYLKALLDFNKIAYKDEDEL